MTKPLPNALASVRVRINPDATDRRGRRHEYAGQEAAIIKRNPGGNMYQLAVDGGQVAMLPLSDFAFLQATVAAPQATGNTSLAMLPIAQVLASQTNPRKRFDPEALQELAASIKLQGLATPILVRRLPAARVQETFEQRDGRSPGEDLPTHEIVAGERRWRACTIAGLREIPVYIRDLTDAQAQELQLVENLQRQDLHPMEEAEGYDRLMHEQGYTAEQIAERVEKSRSHVYVTLKLLALCTEGREAMYAGTLTRSTGLLIARIPTEPLQVEALKRIATPNGRGDVMSYRDAQDFIAKNFMTTLAAAPFNILAADLVRGAGACPACPKRTGAEPDLFEDLKSADICTDTRCFGSKKVAHHEKLLADAAARGQTVISGREALELMPHAGLTPHGYIPLDKPKFEDASGQIIQQPLRTVLGADLRADKVVIIESPHTGELIEAMPVWAAGKALRAKGLSKPEQPKTLTKADLEADYQQRWRRAAVEAVVDAIGEWQDVLELPKAIAHRIIRIHTDNTDESIVRRLFDLRDRYTAPELDSAITRTVDQGKDKQIACIVALGAASDLEPTPGRPTAEADLLGAAAVAVEIDLLGIQEAVQSEMKAEAAERAQAAAPAKKEAPSPARKPKATKTEVQAQIAAAMQEMPE